MGSDVTCFRTRVATWLAAATILGLGSVETRSGTADDAPAIHDTLRDFLPTSKYEYVPEVKDSASPKVYLSARAAAYLVRGTGLESPILVRTGTCGVESLPADAVLERPDGGIDLRADVSLKCLGNFVIVGREMLIDLPGLKAKLSPPPPLLGWHKAAAIEAAVPEYARDAKRYAVNEECVKSLKTTKGKVKVFVYFGTWCPTCSTVMGRVLRLEHELAKDAPTPKEGEPPAIEFDYFGAKPEPETWEEPELKTHGIEILPTGLIYVDGKKRGRIIGFDWSRPEAAIRRVLDAQ